MNKKHLLFLALFSFLCTLNLFSQGKEVWKDVTFPKETNGSVICVETDPKGNVWIGTDNGDLLKFNEEKWTSIDLRSCLNKEIQNSKFSIFDIEFGENNQIWLATGSSAFYFDGIKWSYLKNDRRTLFVNPLKIISKNNDVWMCNSRNLFKLNNNVWTVFSMIPYQMHANRLNGRFLNMEDSEVSFNDTILYDIDTNLTIPGKSIVDMEFDKEGNLWYTTGSNGLVKYDGKSWVNYDKNNSTFPFTYSNKIVLDKNGKLWCGGNKSGVCMLENESWITYTDTNNFDVTSDNVKNIFPDKSGNVWVGLDGGLKHRVIKFTGKSYKVFNETNPRSFGEGIQITIDKNGTKWFFAKWDPIIRTLSDGEGAFYTYKPKLTGKIYYDKNKNNKKDKDETYLANHKVKVQSTNQIAFTDSQGEYVLSLDYGTYALNYLAEGYWSAVKDSTYTVNLNDSVTNLPEIGVYAPEITALERNISLGTNRCGFDVPLYFTYRNSGTTEINGTISITLDTSIHVKYTTPMHDSIRNNKLYFNLAKLPCGTERQINIGMTMPNYTHMGENLRYTTNVHTTNKDFADTLYRVVKCAYDPNEKEVYPTGFTQNNYTDKKEEFKYTIRFQNIGNDTAVNILVQDTLNHQFDLTTFNIVASSHTVSTTLDTNRVANFLFKNILLPDSTTNEAKSHGFVTFSIKRNNKLIQIEEIKNTAYIYFDYNPAVITNTTLNTLVDTIIHTKIEICKGSSYEFPDKVKIENITSSQFHAFVDTINASIRLNYFEIVPYPEISVKQTVNLCEGNALAFGTQLITQTGIYTEIFTSLTGCDSTVTWEVVKDSIDLGIQLQMKDEKVIGIVSKANNLSYQWMNCSNNTEEKGEQAQVFYPTKDASYAVILAKNGCKDTSSCIDFKMHNLAVTNRNAFELQVYPNPTFGSLTIETISECTSMMLVDMQGKIVFEKVLFGMQPHQINLDSLATDSYLLRLQDENKLIHLKITLFN
jgi:uncharacterized repeat protein (TIGR01451 family)